MLSLSRPDRVKLPPLRPLPLAPDRAMREPEVDEPLRTPPLDREIEERPEPLREVLLPPDRLVTLDRVGPTVRPDDPLREITPRLLDRPDDVIDRDDEPPLDREIEEREELPREMLLPPERRVMLDRVGAEARPDDGLREITPRLLERDGLEKDRLDELLEPLLLRLLELRPPL